MINDIETGFLFYGQLFELLITCAAGSMVVRYFFASLLVAGRYVLIGSAFALILAALPSSNPCSSPERRVL